MPFSQQKLDQILTGIERALSSGALNDWERSFLHDMRTKLARYGQGTTLSDKQYRKLMQLAGVDATSLPGNRPNLRMVTPPRQSRSWKPRAGYRRRSRTPWIVRRLRRLSYGLGLIVILASIASIAGLGPDVPGLGAAPSSINGSVQLSGRSIEVIDGDTVRVPGESRRVRLVGFNTPEVFSPRCERELQLGRQATQRLRQLLSSAGTVEFDRVRCACKPGTEGTKACNYGRLCGVLKVNGTDVGQTLISEGLAARYLCGRHGCPPPSGNWCV